MTSSTRIEQEDLAVPEVLSVPQLRSLHNVSLRSVLGPGCSQFRFLFRLEQCVLSLSEVLTGLRIPRSIPVSSLLSVLRVYILRLLPTGVGKTWKLCTWKPR